MGQRRGGLVYNEDLRLQVHRPGHLYNLAIFKRHPVDQSGGLNVLYPNFFQNPSGFRVHPFRIQQACSILKKILLAEKDISRHRQSVDRPHLLYNHTYLVIFGIHIVGRPVGLTVQLHGSLIRLQLA